MGCRKCHRGTLTWDGKRAWRCDSTHTWTDSAGETHRCRAGLSFSALFDCEDLDYLLSVGRPLSTLRLTHYAIDLLHDGEVFFHWLARSTIDMLYRTLSARDLDDAEERELALMMRRGLEPTEVRS
jgi:hypothetical protein